MADMASITAGLNAVKLAFNIAKDLKDATAAFNEAEFRLKLSELYLSLSDARMNLAEAQQEISSLQGEISSLKAQLSTVDELEFRDGFITELHLLMESQMVLSVLSATKALPKTFLSDASHRD